MSSSSCRTCHGIPNLLPESYAASGRTTDKINLPTLQSKMKCDPEGYESELIQLYRHFDSSLHLFQQQASMNLNSVGGDPTVAKELGDMAMFLAHVTPFYPNHLSDFPGKLSNLLRSAARSLPSSLQCHLAQMVGIIENLELFMELQTLGDRKLRKLAFCHVIQSIRRMNQKHKNGAKNRALQNVLFSMLQEEDESKAKRSLVVLCDLHRRRVWFDDRTANEICSASFHSSSRIMISALSFLLGYERIEEGDNSDDSSAEDDKTPQKAHVVISREAVYKAHHKGTSASKKKKQAKLQRAVRTMKKQQRMSSENHNLNYYSPLSHLKDAQGFVDKLFSRLQSCNECFEPHQRDITELLGSAVQACHDMVPPDAVEPLFRQIVNQFVHDRSRTEAIAVGLNVVREICLRMPLLMTEELLRDLVLYKKSHEKSISIAARSLIALFREVCPSLLVKKDRGRTADPKAKPKAFGEVKVFDNVPGAELLDQGDANSDDSVSDNDEVVSTDNENEQTFDLAAGLLNEVEDEPDDESSESDVDDDDEMEEEDSGDLNEITDTDEDKEPDDVADENEDESNDDEDEESDKGEIKSRKRKFSRQRDKSHQALKRLAKMEDVSDMEDASDMKGYIYSDEDFQLINLLEAKKEAKLALSRHVLVRKGADAKQSFKIPNSEQLRVKRVDHAKLQRNIKRKMSKEERLALVRAGREDRKVSVANCCETTKDGWFEQ